MPPKYQKAEESPSLKSSFSAEDTLAVYLASTNYRGEICLLAEVCTW
jgi:hypothetical protein